MGAEDKQPRRDFLKAAAMAGIGFAVGSWAVALSRGKAVVEVTQEKVVETRVIPQVQVMQTAPTAPAAPPHPAFEKRGLAYLNPETIQNTLRVLVPEDSLSPKPTAYNINDLDWIAILIESRYHEPGVEMVGAYTFLDMKNFNVLKRLKNAGDRVHVVRFGREEWPENKRRFALGMSRDCWLSKIDLYTMQIVRQIKIGVDCRSAAYDKDGKYIIAGSKDPGHVVILDADTFKVLKVIPFLGVSKFFPTPMMGRQGAILTTDLGYWLVNVKDAEMVLVIDYRDPEFPIVHAFTSYDNNSKNRSVKVQIGDKTYEVTGIGKSPHELNKLDKEGRYVAVTGQESNTISILDMKNFEIINVVPCGKKPHPGPGTLVPGKYFLTNAIAEGKITVINLQTMDVEKYITYPKEFPADTGGGLYSTPPLPDGRIPKGLAWFDTSFNINKGVFAVDINLMDVATAPPKPAVFSTNKPGKWAMHPGYTPDGRYVISALERTDSVYRVDAETGEIVGTIKLKEIEPVQLLEEPSPTGIFPAWRIKAPWF
ncbi:MULTISPECIES: cytochrome D1 domain-containing protein [Pyrobaculum]|uniref:Cytochrome d1, heme region n=2 Tax=Pyrobaculum arsenaticum TaxID=121277 RepID=A4WIG6_PYRAR|nr:cytochrome D1 domain-containing protein [Pyrobaculum arsenaticum]ABP50183.1 cytochrome d1, heme region [Pyrobaculum arsenaticum DSM 13514]MCY0889923.1 twin-arginine translocation signal domain-containing protein [Pyrobaculum arsenaticum]NYR14879.1 twin-arginine translocation signal domain-containing protein [Pyrobaculum arsenaticum]